MGSEVGLTVGVVLACVALAAAVGLLVARAGSRRIGIAVGLGLGAWLALTAAVASTGLYALDPWLGVGVATPLIIGLVIQRLLVRRLVPSGRSNLVAALAAVQFLRLVGGAFLVLLAQDALPPGFALPAGIGDVVVGLLAPVVAYALWRRPSRRRLGIGFNALGLLDLLVAIPLGLLHAPGQLQLIVTEPTTGIMSFLPIVLVPTFVVPVAIVLHIVSFRLLGRQVTDRPPAVREATDSRAISPS